MPRFCMMLPNASYAYCAAIVPCVSPYCTKRRIGRKSLVPIKQCKHGKCNYKKGIQHDRRCHRQQNKSSSRYPLPKRHYGDGRNQTAQPQQCYLIHLPCPYFRIPKWMIHTTRPNDIICSSHFLCPVLTIVLFDSFLLFP